MSRIDRPELFLRTAHLFALRGTCSRAQVGAVFVVDNRIVATGYNGAPPGMPHCDHSSVEPNRLLGRFEKRHCDRCDGAGDNESGEVCLICAGQGFLTHPIEVGCEIATHAEANAIAFAARHGVELGGSDLFCTHAPCLACARLLVGSGVASVTYNVPYRLTDGVDYLGLAGVPTHRYLLPTAP